MSEPQMDACRTLTSSSPAPGVGMGMSLYSYDSVGVLFTSAFIVFPSAILAVEKKLWMNERGHRHDNTAKAKFKTQGA